MADKELIERRVIAQIRQENRKLDDPIHATGSLAQGTEIPEYLFCLRPEIRRNQLSVHRIQTDLPGDKNPRSGPNRRGIRADRGGCLRRAQGYFFSHRQHSFGIWFEIRFEPG